MDNKLRSYLVELAGTFLVVLIGAGAVCGSHLFRYPQGDPVAGYAIAEGFALAVALTISLYLSLGCLNPAITLMLWVFRRLETRQMVLLILAQLLGAALAGLVLRNSFSDDVLHDSRIGSPYLKASLVPATEIGGAMRPPIPAGTLLSGTVVELVAGLVLTLALFGSYLDPRAPRMGGMLVGLAQAAVIVFAHPLTGGSGNPARWFGPACWLGTLPQPVAAPSPAIDALIYCGGPVLGALAAAFFYHWLVLPHDKTRGHHR
jgi:glycerol uptake facilitator-like aquaporin